MRLFDNFFPPNVVAFISEGPVDFTLKRNTLTSEQREYLDSRLGFPVPRLFNIKQVHSSKIVCPDDEKAMVNADGVVSNSSKVALAVRTADCLPVFLYDPQNHAIGLCHAGWRGSQQTILVHAIRMMNKKWGTETTDLKVAFGPGIRSCCYQVTEDFKKYFPKETIKKDNDYYTDLAQVNKEQLLRMNVRESNIRDCGICTCEDERFFSYRRQKEKAGRMISVMMLKANNAS